MSDINTKRLISKVTKSVSMLALAVFLASCNSPATNSDEPDEIQATSAKSAANAMQRYCVELFPDEAAMVSRLQADGFERFTERGTDWINPSTRTIVVTVMESPTGRGFGCSLNFKTGDDPRVVRDTLLSTLQPKIGFYSTWFVDGQLGENQAIINGSGATVMTDAGLLPYASGVNDYLILYTEK